MSDDKTPEPEVDLIEFATRLRPALEPFLDELSDQPPIRLASIIVAAALTIPADGRTFDLAVVAARKVLADYATAGRNAGPSPTMQ